MLQLGHGQRANYFSCSAADILWKIDVIVGTWNVRITCRLGSIKIQESAVCEM